MFPDDNIQRLAKRSQWLRWSVVNITGTEEVKNLWGSGVGSIFPWTQDWVVCGCGGGTVDDSSDGMGQIWNNQARWGNLIAREHDHTVLSQPCGGLAPVLRGTSTLQTSPCPSLPNFHCLVHLPVFFFNCSIVDLQCCCFQMYSKAILFYIYIYHTCYICVIYMKYMLYIYVVYIWISMFFFRLSSIIGYYEILNIVLWAVQ